MVDENLNTAPKNSVEWFEVEIPVRGCVFSLKQIQLAYSELDRVTQRECERSIAELKQPEEQSDADWASWTADVRNRAFRLTVSIIGGDDNVTKYGETSEIFDDTDLPFPIKTIYFTNETAYKRMANNNLPPNGFQLTIEFGKPPLFDPNPLVGQPTINASHAKLKARDITYFRATQNVFHTLVNKHKHWYSFIHAKFAYDVGLWVVGAPYILYMVTVYCDKFFPYSGPHSSFRVAFYIYGIGIGLMLYRLLYSYLRWAFPVNVLKENKDTATKHRAFFAAIVMAMTVHLLMNVFDKVRPN
jgi:hypothetical protein